MKNWNDDSQLQLTWWYGIRSEIYRQRVEKYTDIYILYNNEPGMQFLYDNRHINIKVSKKR